MIRAVLDTNVVLSGLIKPSGTPARLLRQAGVRFVLVWTPAIVVECRRVLGRPRLQKALGPRAASAAAVLDRLISFAHLVPPEVLADVRVVQGDPDDDVLFSTALAGGARFIVSGDAAVLAVGDFAGVKVVTAAEFLASLGEP